MKKRFYAIAVLIFAVLFLGLIAWRDKQTSVPKSLGEPAASTQAINSVSSARIQPSMPTGKSAPSLLQTLSAELNPKVLAMHAMVAAENAKPLDFYGKAIDQNDAPVVGVEVKAGVGLVASFSHSGGEFYYTRTDTAGKFSFLGIHGAGMGPFILTKEGYTYDQRLPSGSRPPGYIPDSNNPVIFQMWRLKGAEPMVQAKVHAYVPCDGTATSYDILTGRKTANGDLVITLTRDPVQIVRGRPFDWKATVELPSGGGFLKISDPYPNEAPAEGYESKLTVEMPATMKGWAAAFKRSYYFKSGDIYGRMTVSIQADFQPPPTSFDVKIYANPSGSRNLEFDPAKVVSVKP